MSNENKRTVEMVHQEYTQLCAKAGHINYQISVLKTDLDLVNSQLKDLNLEAASLSAKKAKEDTMDATIQETREISEENARRESEAPSA